jgi:hypothetical protein
MSLMNDDERASGDRSVPLYLGAALLALVAGIVAVIVAIVLVKGTL